ECTWCSAPPDEEKTEAEVDTPKSMVTDTTAGEDDDEDAKNQKHTVMVFNEDVEQWIDPAANEIKVTLEPPIPSWIPVAGEITTGHVRSCIPVLQPNGSAISFKTEDQEQVKIKETVNKQQLEQEALKLEEELQKELMSKKHEVKHAANLKKKEEEKKLMEDIKKRKQKHQNDLETAKTQLKTLGKQYFADEEEYLLHSDNWSSNFDDRLWVRDTKKEDIGKGFWLESKTGSEISLNGSMTLEKLQQMSPDEQKKHFPLKITWKLYKLSNITEDKDGPSGRPSWFPEVEPKKDDLDESFQYNVVRIGELLEDWGSRKDREDSEKLDKEEAFAIKSFLEGNIRREKRLLKYNILKVAAHKGSLVPQEPFRMLGAPKSDTKEATIEDHKTKWWFDSEEEEAWETEIGRKAHLEYTPDWQTKLKQLLKDRNISESAEGDAYVVKNAEDKEVKTANLASAHPGQIQKSAS
ncbi:rsph1, partial [Symbiodinium sp. CCMP2456]